MSTGIVQVINFSNLISPFVDLPGKAVHDHFSVLKEFNERQPHGCYICFADLMTGLPFRIIPFGEMTDAEQCLLNCQEKARRLAQHPEHLCSAQSRNDKAKQWPGAIRSNTAIISPSGMPWQLDEVFALALAMFYDGMDDSQATYIASLSGNTRFLAA